MRKVKLIFINVLVLTLTSLCLRSVDLSFQVYLSNKLKPEGIGLYQLIMSIYLLAFIFSTSGVRFATTRLVVEEIGVGRPKGALRALRNCLLYSAAFSTSAMIMLYFGAEYIGLHWLNDRRTILSLRILAVSLPFISLSSVFSGYFFAVRKATLTAVVQLLEPFVKIGTSVVLLWYFLPRGLEYGCAAVTIGACVGEIGSFLFFLGLYRHDRRNFNPAGEPGKKLITRMLHIALPVAFSAYIVSGLRTVQQLLIPYGFKKHGDSSEKALSTYGVIRGMAMPVLLFPSVLLDAVADLIVPELAECKAQNSTKRLNYIISRVFHLGILASLCVMGIFLRFAEELGMIIFHNQDAARFMMLFAWLIPFMYLDNIVDNILKGIDEQVSSMRYNIFVSVIDVSFTFFLLPVYGISGYIFTLYFTKILNFSLSLNRLLSVTKLSVNLKNIMNSILCIFSSLVVADFVVQTLYTAEKLDITRLYFQIPLTVLLYLLFLRILSCLTREDILWIKSLFK